MPLLKGSPLPSHILRRRRKLVLLISVSLSSTLVSEWSFRAFVTLRAIREPGAFSVAVWTWRPAVALPKRSSDLGSACGAETVFTPIAEPHSRQFGRLV